METLESLDPGLIEIDAADKVEMAGEQGFGARAYSYLGVIRRLEFAPVISGGTTIRWIRPVRGPRDPKSTIASAASRSRSSRTLTTRKSALTRRRRTRWRS